MPKKKTVRYTSSTKLMGWPLLSMACGPDSSKGEARGWAHGIIAIGDVATGLIAIGGIASGGISIGGISLGAISVGGVSLGGMVLGGVAVGYLAFGGVAVGHYAKGGAAVGTHVVSPQRRDPEAVRLFDSLIQGGSQSAAKKNSTSTEENDSKSHVDATSQPADASKTTNP